MNVEGVRARLNLLAVLPNLEDVVREDPEMAELARGAPLTVQFLVLRGPLAYVHLADGACAVGAGAAPDDLAGDKVTLWFASPAHLNRMFAGKGNPLPLRGFRRIGFLRKEFTQLTDRMASYLRPTEELLRGPAYLAMNTRLTLHTAVRAVPELLVHDPAVRELRHSLKEGTLGLTVLPDGPSVGLLYAADRVWPVLREVERPSALIRIHGLETASAFLGGGLDLFAAVAKGDIELWGRFPIIDATGLVLDRVGAYLS